MVARPVHPKPLRYPPMFRKIRNTFSFLAALSNGIGTKHLGLIAAGVAFYGLLAIFPAITAVVTLWGFVANPDIVEMELQSYEQAVPAEVYQILSSRVRAIANGPKEVLGWATAISFASALWATRAGVSALIGGMYAVYGTPPRGGLRNVFVAILLTFILLGVALTAMATVVIAPVVLAFLPLGPFTGFAIGAARWLIALGVVLLGVGILYRLGPNRPSRRSRLLSAGSVVAVLLWAIVSFGFSLYLENFSRYNEVYGSLGAVIAMLMWLYLSAFVVLLGGLVNAELAHRKASREADSAEPDREQVEDQQTDSNQILPEGA